MIDYELLGGIAAKQMKNRKAHLNREKGFIYYHGQRGSKSVITLRKLVTEDASHDDALRIAGMFHDIGKGIEPHNETGAVLARHLLADALPQALLEEVVHLIWAHTQRQRSDRWENLLQDADLVDHFGTIDVGMTFQYGAYTEGGMAESLDWWQTQAGGHFEKHRQLLHFDAARAEYDSRIAYTRQFAERFARELDGGYA